MTTLPNILILLAVVLAVFGAGVFHGIRQLVGAQVDCTTNTSRARTFWLISTVTSPSENRPTLAAPNVIPRCVAISEAMPGLALPVKTMKSG